MVQLNTNGNWFIFIQENVFDNVVCEKWAILSQPQCVKTYGQVRSVKKVIDRVPAPSLRNMLTAVHVPAQIARFICGQHGAHLGPGGPRWAPCWPNEPCYQGAFIASCNGINVAVLLPTWCTRTLSYIKQCRWNIMTSYISDTRTLRLAH